jgi:hypothetical protein
MLRCSPCLDHKDLKLFDGLQHTGISATIYSELSNDQRLQASVLFRDGGLGVCSVSKLAMLIVLSICVLYHSSAEPNTGLFKRRSPYVTVLLESYSAAHTLSHHLTLPIHSNGAFGIRPALKSTKAAFWQLAVDDYCRTRLADDVCTSQRQLAIGSTNRYNCSLGLDSQAVTVAVGFKLSTNLRTPICPYGLLADTMSSHSLFCTLASGRVTRQYYLNELVSSARRPATRELAGRCGRMVNALRA